MNRKKILSEETINYLTEAYNLIREIERERVPPKKQYKELKKRFMQRFGNHIAIRGDTKPTKYENYYHLVETFNYRGINIRVYENNEGRLKYFYYNNRCYIGGVFTPNIKEKIKAVIDKDLGPIKKE